MRKKLGQPTEWVIAESSDESLVVFNSVHLEEFNELVAKGNLLVMLLLRFNVSPHRLDL